MVGMEEDMVGKEEDMGMVVGMVCSKEEDMVLRMVLDSMA